MRVFASITAVLLFLFLLTSAPAFSQDNTQDRPQDERSRDKDAKGHEDAKPNDKNGRQDENRRDESRPDTRQQDNRDRDNANRQQDQTRPEERRDEHAGRPQEQNRPQGQVRPEERGDRRVEGNQGRGGEHRGQRIPDDRFRASFGREHHFHVDRARIVNQSQPEFVYSGYTFQLAQPWPGDWSYDDDCYVDYTDGDYYLYDAYHPGIRILVFVIGE